MIEISPEVAAVLAIAFLILFVVMLWAIGVLRKKVQELHESSPGEVIRREMKKAYQLGKAIDVPEDHTWTGIAGKELRRQREAIRSEGVVTLPDSVPSAEVSNGHDWSPAYKACRNCNTPLSTFLVSLAACPGEVEDDDDEQLPSLDAIASNDIDDSRPSGPSLSMDPDRAAAIRDEAHYWQLYQEEPNVPLVFRCNICGMLERDRIGQGALGACPGRDSPAS